MKGVDERMLGLLQEARRQLESERNRREEPIAIVGIGCRFPGGVADPEAFWRLLCQQVDATSEVPEERWSAADYYDPNPDAPGKSYTRRGAFLGQVDGFDAEFFGISAREAQGMDPQQRLLLEVAWEALEDAGIPAESLRGTPAGVWLGVCVDDYARRSIWSGDARRIDAYSALGNTRSIAAGRISYALDLRGPALQLDTACSSSLVSVHLAVQSLRARECSLALAGGVNLMMAPESTVALSKLRALSPDGRCKTFDASADGYGRGEGSGIVVLKRLGDALEARDRIYALVRGSAVNHDGHSNGLTAPNGLAQEAVLQAALANARVEPGQVSFVETHGTGTLLGDPIEVLALNRVYGAGRSPEAPLLLGAVKTNFGHLEGAAGIAGLIKLALCLWHGRLVPNLHFRVPNPKIPWASLPLRVLTEAGAWSSPGTPRLGAVSSFGISGTNAHAILEQPAPVSARSRRNPRAAELLVLSAKSPAALSQLAGKLLCSVQAVEAGDELHLGDLAHSLVARRSLFEQRATASVTSRQSLVEVLRAFEAGELPRGAARGVASASRGQLAWLFSGQGAQRLGMGQQLYEEWRVFRDALDEVCALLDPELERPLRSVMWADPGSAEASLLQETGYTQPALFALQWALSRLWSSWGVKPELVLGHSIGEIAAACVAGVFSLADAARLVSARARLMQSLPRVGAMVSLAAPAPDVARAIEPYRQTVAIAAINGPRSTVISGTTADVQAIAESFSARGIAIRKLAVSHAFHSPLLEPILAELKSVADSLTYRAPQVPLISNLRGEPVGSEILSGQYWATQARAPVRFAQAVESLVAAGARTFLEIGPGTTLLGLTEECLQARQALLLSSLSARRAEPSGVLDALGGWVAHGGPVDWQGIFPEGGERVTLPTYPWQRSRHWIDLPQTASSSAPLEAQVTPASEAAAGQQAAALTPLVRELLALSPSARAGELRALLMKELSLVLSAPLPATLAPDATLTELGLDSVGALELRSRLTRKLALVLPIGLLSEGQTLAAVSALLGAELAGIEMQQASAAALTPAGEPRGSAGSSPAACALLQRARAPARGAIYCFHDAGGSAAMFLPFASLALLGLDVHTIAHSRLESRSDADAHSYVREVAGYIRSSAPQPFAIFGHSLGAALGWRVMEELIASGHPPALYLPSACAPSLLDAGELGERLQAALTHATQEDVRKLSGLASFREDLAADVQLWQAVGGRPTQLHPVRIGAFVASADTFVEERAMLEWQALTTQDFSLDVLPGDHFYVHHEHTRALLIELVGEQALRALDASRAGLPRARRVSITRHGVAT